MTRTSPLAITLFATVAIAGCDPQADSDYQGEALATMQGQIVAETDTSGIDGWRALLVWNNSAGSPDTFNAEDASVTGSFPSAFTLSIFEPPPVEALNDYTDDGAQPDDSRIGVGFMVALPEGISIDSLNQDSPNPYLGPVGMAERYMLVYVESEVKPGSTAERVVGLLGPGFHLMEVIDADDPTCDRGYFDCLVEAPDGMATDIEVKIDEQDNLDPPNWT